MTFDPYLHFQGNARAALEAYREIFGGTVEITTFAEMPEAPAEMRALTVWPKSRARNRSSRPG